MQPLCKAKKACSMSLQNLLKWTERFSAMGCLSLDLQWILLVQDACGVPNLTNLPDRAKATPPESNKPVTKAKSWNPEQFQVPSSKLT